MVSPIVPKRTHPSFQALPVDARDVVGAASKEIQSANRKIAGYSEQPSIRRGRLTVISTLSSARMSAAYEAESSAVDIVKCDGSSRRRYVQRLEVSLEWDVEDREARYSSGEGRIN